MKIITKNNLITSNRRMMRKLMKEPAPVEKINKNLPTAVTSIKSLSSSSS